MYLANLYYWKFPNGATNFLFNVILDATLLHKMKDAPLILGKQLDILCSTKCSKNCKNWRSLLLKKRILKMQRSFLNKVFSCVSTFRVATDVTVKVFVGITSNPIFGLFFQKEFLSNFRKSTFSHLPVR